MCALRTQRYFISFQYYLLTLLFIANWNFTLFKSMQQSWRRKKIWRNETWTINQFIIIVNLSGDCDILTHSFSWFRMKIVISDCKFATLLRELRSASERIVSRPWNETAIKKMRKSRSFLVSLRWDEMLSFVRAFLV